MQVNRSKVRTRSKNSVKFPHKVITVVIVGVVVAFISVYAIISLSPPPCLPVTSKPTIHDSARVGETHSFTFNVQNSHARDIGLCNVLVVSPAEFMLQAAPFTTDSLVINYVSFEELKTIVVSTLSEEEKKDGTFSSNANSYVSWDWTKPNMDMKAGVTKDLNFRFLPNASGEYFLQLYINGERYQTVIINVEKNNTGN